MRTALPNLVLEHFSFDFSSNGFIVHHDVLLGHVVVIQALDAGRRSLRAHDCRHYVSEKAK